MGVYGMFRVSGIVLRELALVGKVPGMRKSSW
jgi:ribosomal protein S14